MAISCAMNSSWRTGEITNGAELFNTFLSENLIAILWVNEVAGAASIVLVGLISDILLIGIAVGVKN